MKKLAATALTLLVLGTSISGLGCAVDNDSGRAPVPLEDTIWVLESFGEAGKLQSPIAGTRITVIFNSDTSKLGGSSGCNSYGGAYQTSGIGSIIIDDLAQTLISCGDRINEQEVLYMTILSNVISLKLEHRKLTLSGPEGVLVFRP